MMKLNLKSLLINSSFLGIIKVATMALGLAQTIILAHFLSTTDFALFSQSNVLIGTIGGVTAFGFADAIIFFSGISNGDLAKKQSMISVIFILELIFCAVAGVLIVLIRRPLSTLFNNSSLSSCAIFISFFPLLVNVSNCLNQLLFTEKKVKSIGIGNLLFSSSSLIIALLIIGNNSPVKLYLILEIVFYCFYIVFLVFCYLREKKRFVQFIGLTKNNFREVLAYSIPIGIAIFSTTMLKELDKIIISNQCSTTDYATYAAVSKQLPLTFFSAAFSAQLIPSLATCRASGDKGGMIKNLKIYYLFGFVSTLVLGLGVLSVSKQALVFLYSEKYVGGLSVFIIYIIVDIFSFAYPGMLLTISGKSKELLFHSLLMLVINFGLDIVLLKLLGIIGPAIATLTVQIGGLVVQTYRGLKINSLRIAECIPIKEILVCIFLCIPATVILFRLSSDYSIFYLVDVLLYGGICVIVNLLFCFMFLRRRIKDF